MWHFAGYRPSVFGYNVRLTGWQEIWWFHADLKSPPWWVNVVFQFLFIPSFMFFLILLFLDDRQYDVFPKSSWCVWQIFSITVIAVPSNWNYRFEGRVLSSIFFSFLYCSDLSPDLWPDFFFLHAPLPSIFAPLSCTPLSHRYKTKLEFHRFSHIWWVIG